MHSLVAGLVAVMAGDDERKKFEKALLVEAAPPAPAPEAGAGPAPAPPVPAPAPVDPFQPGTTVRDFLSGNEGIIAPPPNGEFGDVVFITSKADGKTYPIRKDQLEVVNGAGPIPPAAPAPQTLPAPAPEAGSLPEGAPAPGSPIPGASLKKGVTTTAIFAAKRKSMAKARFMRREAMYAALLKPTDVVTSEGDERKMTYAGLISKIKAGKGKVWKDVAGAIGYIPEKWDAICASLIRDGIIKSWDVKGGKVEAAANLMEKGWSESEIMMEVCGALGAVRADVVKALKADKPTAPKPVEPAGPGYQWAWDSEKKAWIEVKASEVAQGGPIEVSSVDPKSPASGAPEYQSAGREKHQGLPSGKGGSKAKVAQGGPIEVSTSDPKSAASGAPDYGKRTDKPSTSSEPKTADSGKGISAKGGAPAPDYKFAKQDTPGTSPKVKFGQEKAPKEMKKAPRSSAGGPVK